MTQRLERRFMPEKIRKDLEKVIDFDTAEQPLHLALNQLREQSKINFVLDRQTLALTVMRNLRQALAHQFHAAAVEERPITRHRHQHRPTAVIGYSDDAAVLRRDVFFQIQTLSEPRNALAA